MGGRIPKQFLKIGKRTILEMAVEAFDAHPSVGEIVIVAPGKFVARTRKMVIGRRFRKISGIIPGGLQRQESVRRGLESFHRIPSIVLVHDGVRPLVGRRTIEAVIHAAGRFGAAVVGTRVTNTMKEIGRGGFITKTHPRSGLWSVQTPQGFRYQTFRRAQESARKSRFLGTDDASLVERIGIPVKIVEGEERNIKITTREDLRMARFLLLNSRKTGRSR